MNNKQKVLLAGSITAYILFLVFFVMVNLLWMLVTFILQSVLMIAFAYTCWRAATDPYEELQILRADNNVLRDKLEEAEESKVKELAAKDESMKKNKSDLVEAKAQIAELERQVSGLTEELSTAKKMAEDAIEQANNLSDEDTASFLPQIRKQPASTINILEVAKSTAEEMSEAAQKAGLVIRISSNKDSYMVKANPEMLRIMFRNIIDNSIKYMNRHGILIVTVSNIEDDLFIVLKDNGEGLPENETKHIFELNYQGSNRISGNGLGLAQAKAVVEYYGGNIYAKSTPGGGMGIYIQLPTS